MKLNSRQIKASLILIAGTLEEAARQMSDDVYAFNGNQLSKVINGHADTPIIKDRLKQFLASNRAAINTASREQAFENGM